MMVREGRLRRLRQHWLWPQVRPHLRLTVWAAAAVVLQVLVELAMVYLLKVAFDRIVVDHDVASLNALAITYLILVAVQYGAGVVEFRLSSLAGLRVLYSLRTALVEHVLRLSLDYYERERAGGIVARISNDVAALGDFFTRGLVMLAANLTVIAGIVPVLFVLDLRLATASLVAVPLVALLIRRFRPRLRTAYRQTRAAAAEATTVGQETLAGVATVQSHHLHDDMLRRIDAANDAERRAERRTVRLGALFFPSMEAIGTVSTLVVLVAGGLSTSQGTLSVGTLVAFLFYLKRAFDPATELSQVYDMAQSAKAAVDRITTTFAEQPRVVEPPCPAALPQPAGEIGLRDVAFAYGARAALRDVQLRVPPASTVALVGPTGAGKSTIIKLMARFYDPDRGSVQLDGTDLRLISSESFRSTVLYVPQEVFLRAGSMMDNVRYGKPSASDEEVEAAILTVGGEELAATSLWEAEDCASLLSSGQRQLVALARAWLANPPVLLLDEATSHLGAAAEERVHRALRKRRAGMVTFFVSHRLGPVLDADRVAVLMDGRVAQVGSPDELACVPGPFADSYRAWRRGDETMMR